MPFGPALPKGVRTPSTKTTSRSERDMGPPREFWAGPMGAAPSSYPSVTGGPSGPPRGQAGGALAPGRRVAIGLGRGLVRPTEKSGRERDRGPVGGDREDAAVRRLGLTR